MTKTPILIAVAPNGARRSKQDHTALPITPLEIAYTAAACAEAGAGMIHLHVRDDRGNHTLEPSAYRPVIAEVEAAVGDRMLIQVSSESAGTYSALKQMELMRQLAPHCISCGLREFVPDESYFESGARFFAELAAEGSLVQYILYSPDDVKWFETLYQLGVVPESKHMLLFVLGRHEAMLPNSAQLDDYVMALKRQTKWMVCAFGSREYPVMRRAAECGGHIRVGFENNLHLPSGALARDNSELVKITAQSARSAGRECGEKDFAESLF